MRISFYLIVFLSTFLVEAQNKEIDFEVVDSLYREDQFYFNFCYANLRKSPDGFSQNKFSTALGIGFLRDMPVNKNRTFAFAAGPGYSFSTYNHNLLLNTVDGTTTYSIIDNTIDYSKNKLSLHFIDVPFEIRWRNSTPESHKFWRIYTGIKLSYLIHDNYKLVSSTLNIKNSGNDDLNKLHYGAYSAIGWNTWTIYMYYGLNPLFKSSAKIDSTSIDMQTINFGLMFYIL